MSISNGIFKGSACCVLRDTILVLFGFRYFPYNIVFIRLRSLPPLADPDIAYIFEIVQIFSWLFGLVVSERVYREIAVKKDGHIRTKTKPEEKSLHHKISDSMCVYELFQTTNHFVRFVVCGLLQYLL